MNLNVPLLLIDHCMCTKLGFNLTRAGVAARADCRDERMMARRRRSRLQVAVLEFRRTPKAPAFSLPGPHGGRSHAWAA